MINIVVYRSSSYPIVCYGGRQNSLGRSGATEYPRGSSNDALTEKFSGCKALAPGSLSGQVSGVEMPSNFDALADDGIDELVRVYYT